MAIPSITGSTNTTNSNSNSSSDISSAARTSFQGSNHRSSTSTLTSMMSTATSTTATTSATLSILSVPVMNPYYRDLQALKADYASLQQKLKMTQRTLQGCLQDLVVAQERSKRAETDSGRLHAQMDMILKRHVDHHPEREALVQQLAELQARLDLELGFRSALEQEHSALQHELLHYRFGNGHSTSPLPTSSASTATATAITPASPTDSPASTRSLSFSSFLRGGSYHRKNKSSVSTIGRRVSISSSSVHDVPIVNKTKSSPPPPYLGAQGENGEIKAGSYPEEDQESAAKQQQPQPTLDDMKTQKQLCGKLQEENVAMKMELQALRYRYQAEKDSIKAYMSLFESLQKKQANALAVALAEMELLRATVSETQQRLTSRESLLHSTMSTVHSQALDLEVATTQSCRDQVTRAQTEQEMATLVEASLLMLERFLENVSELRAGLGQAMEPMGQTIRLLEIPSVVEEWEILETQVEDVVRALETTLVRQQELQEWELTAEGSGSKVKNNNKGGTHHRERQHRGSISSIQSAMSATTKARGGCAKGQNDDNKSNNNDTSVPMLDNSLSQEVFVWRKYMADSFLEECVKGIELLAAEKKELQIQVTELTRRAAESGEEQPSQSAHTSVSVSEIDVNSPPLDLEANVQSKAESKVESSESASNISNSGVPNLDSVPSQADPPQDEQLKRAQRLESILNKVVKWADQHHAGRKARPSAAKKEGLQETRMNSEDEILSLGISEALSPNSLELSSARTSEVTESDTVASRDLEMLLNLIRQELPDNSSDGYILPSNSSKQGESKRIRNGPRAGSSGTRPKIITTLHSNTSESSSASSYPPTTGSPHSSFSSASSCLSSPSYFSGINFAGLSIPASFTGLGGIVGPDGKTVLDVDALCRDLAFRSFPKQHHWSKSRIASPALPASPLTMTSRMPLPLSQRQ